MAAKSLRLMIFNSSGNLTDVGNYFCILTWVERSFLIFVISVLIFFWGSEVRAQEPSEKLTAHSSTLQSQEELQFWQYLPEGYGTSQKKFPLILFLHGGGESGDDLELVKKHGVPKEIINGRELPCIVLAPQNPRKEGLWDDRVLIQFLDEQIKTLRVDESRIYLAGLSRGGHGVYRLVVQNPKKFAAAVVVCGGGPIAYAGRCRSTPFWFYHGKLDHVVPVEESQRLRDAIKKAGGKAYLTIYKDYGHNVWEKAFAFNAMYRWMLAQQREDFESQPESLPEHNSE